MSLKLAEAAPKENHDDGRADEILDLVRLRYRQLDVSAPADANETLEVLLSHRSVRSFLPDPLPQGLIETLVAAAQSAASSSNLQVWSVIAVEDKERKDRLAALANNQAHIRQAPLFLLWIVDLARSDALAAQRGKKAEALDYLESFLLGAVDTSLAAQNAVVALESLGLGAVYIGAIRNKPTEVAKELALPPNAFALFGLAIGRPNPASPAAVKPRLPQEAVLYREQYSWGQAQRDAVATYDTRLRTFQQEQGLPLQDWSELVLKRLEGAPSLHGRDRLREALTQLGFGLK